MMAESKSEDAKDAMIKICQAFDKFNKADEMRSAYV